VNTENVVKHLRVLWRTDRIIADIRMQHVLVSMVLRALAALIAAFGLLMLELAAYFALVQFWNAISAAAILGAVNFVIAAALFAIAARRPIGRDLELASEIHDSSIDALQLEARALQSQLSGMIHYPQKPEKTGCDSYTNCDGRSRIEMIVDTGGQRPTIFRCFRDPSSLRKANDPTVRI
jgi:hypothetical protein